MPKSELQKRIEELIKAHAGVRAAADAVDINASYLLRIRDGKHPQVTDKTLKKLGLRRVEHFVRIGG